MVKLRVHYTLVARKWKLLHKFGLQIDMSWNASNYEKWLADMHIIGSSFWMHAHGWIFKFILCCRKEKSKRWSATTQRPTVTNMWLPKKNQPQETQAQKISVDT